MKHDEGTFEGAKGLKIYYQCWIPERLKAVIMFIHGVCGHSGRFPYLVEHLTSNGYAIYADDHRGHGRSEGTRIFIDSFDQYAADEKILFDIIREKNPKIPVFMVGFSLGFVITLLFTKEYEHLLKGIVLAGTNTRIKINPLIKLIAPLVSKLFPRSGFGEPIDPKLMSSDPEIAKLYANDPLVYHGSVTVKYSYEGLKLIKKLESYGANFKIPLLIQNGSDDQLTNSKFMSNEKGDLETFFKMEDKKIIFYDGLYHDIYNEREEGRKIVLKDLVDWLNTHL